MAMAAEQTLEVYNEAHLVFLFDESLVDDVRACDPLFIEGGKPFQARKFERLFSAGKLIIYDLYQDDSVVLRLVERAQPMSAEELGTPIIEPVSAGLSLPTGRLSVHTLNTLPDGAGDAPATTDLTPGRWQLTIYRRDWEAGGASDDATWSETIALNRTGRASPGGFFCRHGADFDCAGADIPD